MCDGHSSNELKEFQRMAKTLNARLTVNKQGTFPSRGSNSNQIECQITLYEKSFKLKETGFSSSQTVLSKNHRQDLS